VAVREHLSTCASCRQELIVYRSLRDAGRVEPAYTVSDEFNQRLLNRIARERFAETRTKAYMPRPAPWLSWTRWVPATVAAVLVAVVGLTMLTPSADRPGDANRYSGLTGGDDAYLTVQPVNNPNVTSRMKRNWSLQDQLARTARLNRVSNHLASQTGFVVFGDRGNSQVVTVSQPGNSPFGPDYFKMRPVIRVYNSAATAPANGEDGRIY
jgi:hypothetical protein